MSRQRLFLVIALTLAVVALGVVAVSCVHDGSFLGIRPSNELPATNDSLTSEPTERDTDTPEPESPIADVNFSSFEHGDLLFNAVSVDRHGLDLPTFMAATVTELSADERVEILDSALDGTIRLDGAPVSVISFRVADTDSPLELVGRQYAVVSPDGAKFSVLTCITDMAVVNQCDDEMRTIDLTAIQ